MNIEKLIKLAYTAREKAYTPYSNFKVGAAVVTENNNIYSGCNIENAAYSPSICAERTAIFKAISEGESKIKLIVIVGTNDFTYPCGVCRQVIKEFAKDTCKIIVANNKMEYKTFTLDELLPYSFGPEDLRR
ncbi:cytidine deaminase [Miniphocaeibacter halophilus]|uniref:Cytidine deaminase n=1 Tax=Miniphocaeibacter halophilus TaxID=2931922 RepID=A0AC61N107_9FIRM|nr:cytidine deaminase [Miniphocaeibacter halophilus]QQK07673.1 cytidine deaminase [Miniphocaeibacter halophilus]